MKKSNFFPVFLIIFLSGFNPDLSIAQGSWNFFSKENGSLFPLSSKIIFEDTQNHLWVGTDYGLFMFDGEKWNRYLKKEGLLSPNVTAIMQDSKGTVWIGTQGGISTFANGILKKTERTLTGGFPRMYISCIYEDSQGNIWFGTGRVEPPLTNETNHVTGLIMKYTGDTCIYLNHFSDPPLFNKHPVKEIMEDKNGNFWVASGWVTSRVFAGHLSMYDNGNWNYYISKIPYEGEWIIDDIYKDLSGDLWFQARSNIRTGCLIQYDGNELKFHTRANGLLNYVNHFYEDSNSRLWFGGSRGLVYREEGEYHYLENENNEPIPVNVHVIKEDTRKNVWIGTNLGVYVFTGNNRKHFSTDNGLSGESNNVRMIAQDFEGNMWILTRESGFSKIKYYLSKINTEKWRSETVPLDKIHNAEKVANIYEDSAKNIWFFTASGISKYSQ